ncbi:4-phosphoerythronate dehydrogenase [Congregibacter litoralis]|uniref:4-phosphoerythronate dehydrogenase n=1 Tax=Congregibacter litoralis KT71 TaxID=314285 RepID=A4A3J0_9GAMM|nr:4-phosphoerythronate dehydrogenase [Congregibacter litoralis]EAQ99263.1 4-phosphoerythronate dehydrogenase [Congregibacter litoralis KT71]
MINVLADENMVGLERLPRDRMHIQTIPGRRIATADLEGIDVLWVRSVTQVSKALVQDSQLSFVGTATAGFEHIDQEALKARGISFSAAPGANANSVVEYVLAALAELREPWECLERGEPLGVVGCGAVGSLLVTVAKSLGWVVKVYDPWRESREGAVEGENGQNGENVESWASLDDVLACRVITLHCSLHKEEPWPSHHLIGKAALACLNSSQWLINAARGPAIDNQALLEHLRGPDPVNCVLDVWEGEPDSDWTLLDSPTLKIATAHIAGYSWDAKWQATKMLYEQILARGLVDTPLGSTGGGAGELLPVQGRGCDFALALLQQRYTIRTDDELFRDLVRLPLPERAAGFDALRRGYRKRAELRGSQLPMSGGEIASENRRIAQAFGVSLV